MLRKRQHKQSIGENGHCNNIIYRMDINMNQTLIALKARRDVLLMLHKAVTSPKLKSDKQIGQIEGGIVALDLAISTVEIMGEIK